jgi:hypothetical protein
VTDASGATAATACAIVVSAVVNTSGKYTTFTQGGWGSAPHGNNPGAILVFNWGNIYGSTIPMVIGGSNLLSFTNAAAIQNFLPQGGKPGILAMSSTNPSKSEAGVFAGQVLTLNLNVAFSLAGVFHSGLADLSVQTGKMKGQTVRQVLTIANLVLGGSAWALPANMTISDLNDVVDTINSNFDEGTEDHGYLR